MKKIFLYVGHSNWGKSFALKEITNGAARKKTTIIGDKSFFVRKMSNDDRAESLLKFVNKIKDMNYDNFIIAYCPNQENDEGAKKILQILKDAGYLFFFVQQKQFKGDGIINDKEIDGLKNFGVVEILTNKEESEVRAENFKNYILKNLK